MPRHIIAEHVSAGMNDREIAAFYGVKAPSVWAYRRKHRIPCNRNIRLYKVPRDVIQWLVDRGLTDGEIGRIFRVSAEAVCVYRYKKCIPSLRPHRRGWAA